MILAPTSSAVTSPPLVIVATPVLVDVQTRCPSVVRSCVLPSVNIPVAIICCVSPTNNVRGCGDRVRRTNSAAVTVTVAVALPPLRLAVMVALPSPTVFTGKSALSAPAATVTVAGTCATFVALLVKEITAVSVGARSNVTRNTPGFPLGLVRTVPGGSGAMVLSAATTGGGGDTETTALAVEPLIAAVSVALPATSAVTGIVAVN